VRTRAREGWIKYKSTTLGACADEQAAGSIEVFSPSDESPIIHPRLARLIRLALTLIVRFR
jgi:hypothetical protein